MDPKLINNILKDSAELLTKTAELSKIAEEVPGLRSKVAALETTNATLAKQAEDLKANLRTKVEKFASRLVEHGSLTEGKKAEFITALVNDPTQVVEVMEKLASDSSAIQLGSGIDPDNSAKTAGDDAKDPIVQWAMGGGTRGEQSSL